MEKKENQNTQKDVSLDQLMRQMQTMQDAMIQLQNENNELKNKTQSVTQDTISVRCNILENIELLKKEGDKKGIKAFMLKPIKIRSSYFESMKDRQSFAELFSKGILSFTKKEDYVIHDMEENISLTKAGLKKLFNRENKVIFSKFDEITNYKKDRMMMYHLKLLIAYYMQTGDIDPNRQLHKSIEDYFGTDWTLVETCMQVRIKDMKK